MYSGLCRCPVHSIDALIEDPRLNAIGLCREVDHPTEGRLRQAGLPIRFSRTLASMRLNAPTLGEHEEEIRRHPHR